MAKYLKADQSAADAWVVYDLGAGTHSTLWVTADVMIDTATLAAWASAGGGPNLITLSSTLGSYDVDEVLDIAGQWSTQWSAAGGTVTAGSFVTVEFHHVTSGASELYVAGTLVSTGGTSNSTNTRFVYLGQILAGPFDPGLVYFDNVKIGTTRGASDLFSDNFEGGDLTKWTQTGGDVSVYDTVNPTRLPGRRVGIAWDDTFLEPSPTWEWIDGDAFPANFVTGYDTKNGRQSLISQTETGTATVYIMDRDGLLDDRNSSSAYQGKLSGKQIILQLYNPVSAAWETEFRGWIDNYSYDIDGSAVDANGDPINATIQIDCVDMFDYLNGYGLTPGLDGVLPTPSGMEDGVYYAATSGTVDDRIIEILTDVGIDSTRYIVASGNVKVISTKYDPDESALTALRDAADAELPFIANIYIDRYGRFAFRGRYSRFAPDSVAAEPGANWDFTRWYCGDGAAITDDPTRAQMRILEFERNRADLINAAICWPQGLAASSMSSQVYADTTSITNYGKHQAAPISDLLTSTYAGPGTITPTTGAKQCALYAELLVKNKKDPRVAPTALQFKSIQPNDFRASATWDLITRADISHIVNIAAGYPGGTGFTGSATADDYYIEGRALTVRPANTSYDYVEFDLEVSPYVWSADTNGVFPAFGS